MKCIHCQGEMTKGTAPVHIDRDACHVTLDRVPAWVCSQCGEAYFEEGEVEKIQEVIQSVEKKAAEIKLTA
jgi:YgiT-type zinc finger domain-containing protein